MMPLRWALQSIPPSTIYTVNITVCLRAGKRYSKEGLSKPLFLLFIEVYCFLAFRNKRIVFSENEILGGDVGSIRLEGGNHLCSVDIVPAVCRRRYFCCHDRPERDDMVVICRI